MPSPRKAGETPAATCMRCGSRCFNDARPRKAGEPLEGFDRAEAELASTMPAHERRVRRATPTSSGRRRRSFNDARPRKAGETGQRDDAPARFGASTMPAHERRVRLALDVRVAGQFAASTMPAHERRVRHGPRRVLSQQAAASTMPAHERRVRRHRGSDHSPRFVLQRCPPTKGG